jgi:hypothetical protein
MASLDASSTHQVGIGIGIESRESNLEDTRSDSMVRSTRTPSVIFLFIDILVETEIKSCHWDILISEDSLGHPNLAGDLTSPRWTTLLTSPSMIKQGWLLTCRFSLSSRSYVIILIMY